MIIWKDLESEIRLPSVTHLFQRMDCYSSICALLNLVQGIWIYTTKACLENIFKHVAPESKEVGGLLLGQIYCVPSNRISYRGYLTIISLAIRSDNCRSSSVSLEMGTDVWTRAIEHISKGNIVVGWYHSHPYLGAFFSGRDRKTQIAFFNQPYSLGLVIDPFQTQQKIFVGPHSEEYQHDLVVIDHALEMA